MDNSVKERVLTLSHYIIKTGATVRQCAAEFSVSKSTVHTDVTHRLEKIDKNLYSQVRLVLDTNKSQRHIRGGMATKKKYRCKHGQ